MSHSLTLTYTDSWADPVGKTFVLGRPNAKGEYVITLGGTRWLIANTNHIPPGERVTVTGLEGEVLAVARA